MVDQLHSTEVSRWGSPSQPTPCLTGIPPELVFNIIKLALAVGQERDISALARTNRKMRFVVNPELYRLVIKHKLFYIAHWAAQENRLGTLRIAFANGLDPMQMRTSVENPDLGRMDFRPAGWGLNAAFKLDHAVSRQSRKVANLNHLPAIPLQWHQVWFSSVTLSMASKAQLNHLLHHYQRVMNPYNPNDKTLFWNKDDTRVVQLPKPHDEHFVFPEKMSSADMDGRDVKIGFVRLFQYWDTPLHVAARNIKTSVTKALLANGADVDCTSTKACRCSRGEMPTSVRRASARNIVAAYTPLHVAMCVANYGVAKVLVANGADRMAMIFSGNDDREWLSENPLHRALSIHAGYGFNYNFIEFLLDQGYAARIEERNHEDLTPLLMACHSIGDPAQMDILRLLLRYGADPDNPGPCAPGIESLISPNMPVGGGEWASPALWATRDGHFRVAELLLDHGADANARSSILQETMLYAVCTVKEKYHRTELLDALLARDAARGLNTFDENDHNLLMGLINFKLFRELHNHIGDCETRLFQGGADIMAGVEIGKIPPFERMIIWLLDFWSSPSLNAPLLLVSLVDRMLAIMQAFNIKQHPYKPRAMLNQFWGHLKRAFLTPWNRLHQIVPNMLLALITAGFSPAEVDRHGDTAMTSFLQQLLDTPQWAFHDNGAFCTDGWLLPMIMALLQEHGAALHKRNDKGCTAFDYLEQIVKYDGEDEDLVMLARVMRRSVKPGLDVHGERCFKFHPMILFGILTGDNTLQRLQRNISRWLVCEHYCRRYCGNSSTENWECGCARSPFQTFADCEGDCGEDSLGSETLSSGTLSSESLSSTEI